VSLPVLISGLTAILALVFAIALVDQWRDRRHAFQLIWAAGILFYGIGAGCAAVGGAAGWSEPLYQLWYLTGALWTASWLGLGTAYLLGRTRFGYAYAGILVLAGMATFFSRNRAGYEGAGAWPVVYLLAAIVFAAAIGVTTYFQDERWPRLAGLAVVGATILSIVLMAVLPLGVPGYALDPTTGSPVASPIIPGPLRLLVPLMNITGGLSLILGALFSAYVFMPKRRVLDYSLDPNQPGDQFLFNLAIALPAIVVNFAASLPGAVRALFRGELHSRVAATLLIAIGASIPAFTDELLVRAGFNQLFELGKLLGLILMFAGFLISSETFREVRVPFTSIRLRAVRTEPAPIERAADYDA
jgi:hypothetical protein